MLKLAVLISIVVAPLSAVCPISNRYKWLDGKWIEAGTCYLFQGELANIDTHVTHIRYECSSSRTAARLEFINEAHCMDNSKAIRTRYVTMSPCEANECDASNERFLKFQFNDVKQESEETFDGNAEVFLAIGRKSIKGNKASKVQSKTSSWLNYGIVAIIILIVLFIISL